MSETNIGKVCHDFSASLGNRAYCSICGETLGAHRAGDPMAYAFARIMDARPQDRDESTRYAVAATLAWIALCDVECRRQSSAQIAEYAIAKFLDHQARPRTDTR